MNALQLLQHPTRHLFFTGKGGVGKTSLSTASAITPADSGKQVLLAARLNGELLQMAPIAQGLSENSYTVPRMVERPVGLATLGELPSLSKE
ncbi:ArsA domain containing protein [Comamonadaceae bacterium]